MHRSVQSTRATLLLALLLALTGGRPAEAQGTLERIRQSGKIVIGTDATYPPFEMTAGDHLEGFDIDLGEALAARLGVRAEWANVSFDGLFPALVGGKFDLAISAITITPEREQSLAFSLPYYDAGQIIVVREGTPQVDSLADLRGRSVGVQLNTTGQYAVEKEGGIALRKYSTIDLALLDLQHERLDAVVADAPTAYYMLQRQFPTLTTAGKPFTDEHYGIAMRRGDRELQDAVNAALIAIRRSGRYDQIHRSWFGRPAATAETSPLFQLLPLLLRGACWTLELSLCSFIIGLPLGLLISLARLSQLALARGVSGAYVEVLRGTPLLVQIFFLYFVLPFVGLRLPAAATAVLALSVNASAYIAEICRAGILSIDVGQMEAARSLGMSLRQAFRHVILPQAFRRITPPLTNELVALLKDSSLVSIMGLTELTRAGQELASRLANPLLIWPTVALFYFCMTFPLSRLSRSLEQRWRIERTVGDAG